MCKVLGAGDMACKPKGNVQNIWCISLEDLCWVYGV